MQRCATFGDRKTVEDAKKVERSLGQTCKGWLESDTALKKASLAYGQSERNIFYADIYLVD